MRGVLTLRPIKAQLWFLIFWKQIFFNPIRWALNKHTKQNMFGRLLRIFYEIKRMGSFCLSCLWPHFLSRVGKCSFFWSVQEIYIYIFLTTKDERPHRNYLERMIIFFFFFWPQKTRHHIETTSVCTLYQVPGTYTWYLVCLQQQYSFKAKLASTHPNIVHQHVPPLHAQLFRPQARGATAPRCRACSASRENLVGLTNSLTATNRIGIRDVYRSRSVSYTHLTLPTKA